MLIDGVLLGLVMAALQIVIGAGAMGAFGTFRDPGASLVALAGSMMLLVAIAFVGQWLYFALFESGAMQATPGKRALGLKVVDDDGARIGFGRASGRFFGKIVSGAVFYIGFLMVGFSERKQALHDMMANTLVVFRDVQAGQPMPSTKPPMPWYGWLVNVLFLGLPLAALLALLMFGGPLLPQLPD
jgi:uncharacterized RDD family membrane protein YckC